MLAQALRTYWRMDTIALINTLAAEPSVAAAPSQPAAKQGSGQLDVVSQSPTADNAPVDTQETINEPAQDFSQTLQEKIDQQTGQEGQAVAETGQEGQVVVAETGQEGQAVVAETGQEGQAVAENPISNGFQVAGEAQPALDQGSLNVVGILTQG